MAFSGGFNKNSGTTFQSLNPMQQAQFGNFPPSPSPSPPISPFNNHSPSQRSPKRLDTGMGFFSDNGFTGTPQRGQSHHFTSGGNPPNNVWSRTFEGSQKPTRSPPRWGAPSKPLFGDLNRQTHQGPSSVPSDVASLSAVINTPARPANFHHDPRRTKSPPSANEVYLDAFTQDMSGRGLGAPQRMQSPPQAFDGKHTVQNLRHPFGEAHSWPINSTNFQDPKKPRSPPLQSANEHNWRNFNPSQGDTDRAVVSPPMFGNTSTLSLNKSNSTIQQRSSPFVLNNEAKGAGSKTQKPHVPKRNRSPSLPSAEEHLPGASYSPQDDTEREKQAKAKRLARFGVELSQPVQKNLDQIKHKSPENRRKLVADQPIEAAAGDFMQSDYEGVDPSSVIIGLCPDMCPESERMERERKGDLDKYERLDGDRNQTSISLAVKKYNRTAEREADLIRPMPVLQETIDYLLALLDQPYDDRFLAMYNFLWDRMRAIRMDLRMQHIFNQDSITMLEQMIRLHVIAMHELCEYTKGEGFSEGFDAHLNIEQMNKTSVELFQMYEDHRKKGSAVASEKEFRGYYALLKLDKHPGYKVEPAELSLDLAKMTPEIRQTSEILFARDVARACRTGNFIAFFRLARKATYLQACLMHAHFAKLRTQALASLHSGLQNNQGIPVAQVTKWLGMEEEDIEGLLEYHGFFIKEFEESYMVKEGLFLNSDKDYPTKCSQLVHLKKSRRIMEDVSSSNQLMWPTVESKQIALDKKANPDPLTVQFVKSRPSVQAVDEVMLTFEEDSALKDGSQVQPVLETSLPTQMVETVWPVSSPRQSSQSAEAKVLKVGKPAREILRNDSLDRTLCSNIQGASPKSAAESAQQCERSKGSPFESWMENSAQIVTGTKKNDETLTVYEGLKDDEAMVDDHELENEEDMTRVLRDNEVATAKLKLLLRKWKRLASKRKELREQHQLAAKAALSSLTLGLPLQQIRTPSSHVPELDIDRALRERRGRHQKSWSSMNISEVVGGILSERNPDAQCLCWKLIVCSQLNISEGHKYVQKRQTNHSASLWLHSKLMGVRKDDEDELVVSSPELSIWEKWFTHQYDGSPVCCLSVIREATYNMFKDVDGAGGILFLVSESIPLDVQKTQLQNLSRILPSGSCLPLLILCGNQKEGSTSIVNGLDLHDLDKTRISSFSIGSLVDDKSPERLDGFFSSERLREGLQWLASQSPVQSVVHCLKTRNLVMDHLSPSLVVLENMDISVVGPNHCISTFNEALDRSAIEIATAAGTNPSNWPCLEITLLESSNEHSVVLSFLPTVGWSSDTTIEPVLSRIQNCKLPFFPDDLSWLNVGSDTGDEILHHKSELEKCLIRYLTDSCKMMDTALATTEACLILQKGALLELEGSKYCIKPKWVAILRRIFNWRLMNLSNGVDSMAYVLDHQRKIVTSSNVEVEKFNTGTSSTLHGSDAIGVYGSLPSMTQPSLDELIGVCYNTRQIGRDLSEPDAIVPYSWKVCHGKEALHAATVSFDMEMEDNHQQEVECTEISSGDAHLSSNFSREITCDDYLSREMVVANKGRKEADKLTKLLEQCNIVQNKIDEKLSIYF